MEERSVPCRALVLAGGGSGGSDGDQGENPLG